MPSYSLRVNSYLGFAGCVGGGGGGGVLVLTFCGGGGGLLVLDGGCLTIVCTM